MTISELLQGSAYELTVFKPEEIRAVEMLISEKGDKIFVKCQVRGKEVLAKPEEIVRQLWIFRLIDGYKYPIKRLAVEYPITFGRDTSKRADIVVFDEDRATVPYLITEVKKPNAKDGKEQLKSYTHATGAPLALWSNGAQTIIWHRKNPNYFVIIPDLPTASSPSGLESDFSSSILLPATAAHKTSVILKLAQVLPGCGCCANLFLVGIGSFSSFYPAAVRFLSMNIRLRL